MEEPVRGGRPALLRDVVIGPLPLAAWLVSAGVTLGLLLACYAVLERRLPGALRPVPLLHGGVGAAGLALFLGMGRISGAGLVAALMLGMALAGGVVVGVARWRRRTPSGMAVVLHAVLGGGGLVMLFAAL